ncbi:unnamed protein product, partial [Musa hybrid cultivar]
FRYLKNLVGKTISLSLSCSQIRVICCLVLMSYCCVNLLYMLMHTELRWIVISRLAFEYFPVSFKAIVSFSRRECYREMG